MSDDLAGTRWLHRVRRSYYVHLGGATVLTDQPIVEDERVVIHRDPFGVLWVRSLYPGAVELKAGFVGIARVQAATPLGIGSPVVVYRAEADESLWVRATIEFYDGRFERLPAEGEADVYHYSDHRHKIFTEEGQRMFLQIRDRSKAILAQAGAADMGSLIAGCQGGGDSWHMLACVDRLVELGELLEVPNPHSSAGQHRLFIRGKDL